MLHSTSLGLIASPQGWPFFGCADVPVNLVFHCFDCFRDILLEWVDLVVLQIKNVTQICELLSWILHRLFLVDLNAQTCEELDYVSGILRSFLGTPPQDIDIDYKPRVWDPLLLQSQRYWFG